MLLWINTSLQYTLLTVSVLQCPAGTLAAGKPLAVNAIINLVQLIS
jgi:hypothetical protein